MRKLLLLAAGAFMAISANAQTIVQQWSHDISALGTNVRNVVCVGTEAAVANMGTGLVEFYGASGKLDKSFDVNAFCEENSIGYVNGDGEFVSYTIGRGISADGAGNIVVNLNFPNAASSTNFVAIKPDGTMKHIVCENASPARCDFFSVTGDVFDGKAFIAITMNGSTDVPVYSLYEGEYDADYSFTATSDVSLTNEVKPEFVTRTLSEEGVAPDFYIHHRGQAALRYWDGSEIKTYTVENKTTATGITAFTVNKVPYLVVPVKATDGNRKTSFAVISTADGSTLISSEGANPNNPNYAQDYSATVNAADETVNIAQLIQGKTLAMYHLTLPVELTAIETVEVDANAPVEYYNLQGVKVANPESGLFIKKQGSKTTKVVL